MNRGSILTNDMVGLCYVAQVRAIFQPRPPPRSRSELPFYLAEPLVYVQPFRVLSSPDDWPELGMYVLKREFIPDRGMHCRGLIVPMASITHAVELVPLYGTDPLSSVATSTTS